LKIFLIYCSLRDRTKKYVYILSCECPFKRRRFKLHNGPFQYKQCWDWVILAALSFTQNLSEDWALWNCELGFLRRCGLKSVNGRLYMTVSRWKGRKVNKPVITFRFIQHFISTFHFTKHSNRAALDIDDGVVVIVFIIIIIIIIIIISSSKLIAYKILFANNESGGV